MLVGGSAIFEVAVVEDLDGGVMPVDREAFGLLFERSGR